MSDFKIGDKVRILPDSFCVGNDTVGEVLEVIDSPGYGVMTKNVSNPKGHQTGFYYLEEIELVDYVPRASEGLTPCYKPGDMIRIVKSDWLSITDKVGDVLTIDAIHNGNKGVWTKEEVEENGAISHYRFYYSFDEIELYTPVQYTTKENVLEGLASNEELGLYDDLVLEPETGVDKVPTTEQIKLASDIFRTGVQHKIKVLHGGSSEEYMLFQMATAVLKKALDIFPQKGKITQ